MNSLKQQLIFAVTAYDRKQSKRKYYNIWALPQYISRINDIMEDIDNGASPKNAIMHAFTGGIRTTCLKAIGEKADHTEITGWTYKPASKTNGEN